MRRILLVKTSSLGDVVHNLPVVSDIRRACGDVANDWVVEKSFASIPAMHPGVRRVIVCEMRQWRSALLSRATRRAWQAFVGELRMERYDYIIDTQGLLKSAIVARAAHGRRVGLDWRSSREPLRLFYDQVFSVPWSLHAVERNRRLAALALGYDASGEAHYGISAERSSADWLPRPPYAVLLHASSQPRKCWAERAWVELSKQLAPSHLSFVLPWGNASEHGQAQRLAASMRDTILAPQLSVADLASVIAGARFVVGVDTGFTHLAAALGVPVVGVYGATDPDATGVRAPRRAVNLGGIGLFPSVEDVIEALRGLEVAA